MFFERELTSALLKTFSLFCDVLISNKNLPVLSFLSKIKYSEFMIFLLYSSLILSQVSAIPQGGILTGLSRAALSVADAARVSTSYIDDAARLAASGGSRAATVGNRVGIGAAHSAPVVRVAPLPAVGRPVSGTNVVGSAGRAASTFDNSKLFSQLSSILNPKAKPKGQMKAARVI